MNDYEFKSLRRIITMDDLYLEILYQILHSVGKWDYIYVSRTGFEVEQPEILSYIQGAFKMSHDKHSELLKEAEAKQYPELMLNVEVVEGKDLVPKDPTGLSNPFVTIYLMSNTAYRYNTTVKSATLNPTWEEHFSLFVPGTLKDNSLCLEVWDASEARNDTFEVFKHTDPSNAEKDFRKSASMKRQDQLIGTAKIPLKFSYWTSIPDGELSEYLYLNSKRNSLQGVLKVNCSFSLDKDLETAIQEHRILLRILFLHELEKSEGLAYWEGNFSAPAEAILTEHVAQSSIGQADNWLAQWTVFCELCAEHPICFTVFDNVLGKITSLFLSTLTGSTNEEKVELFWEGAKRLLPVCFNYINKKRDLIVDDDEAKIESDIETLRVVLTIIDKLMLLELPQSTDLFPTDLYGWLTIRDDEIKLSSYEVLSQAVRQNASDWFVHILSNNDCEDKTEESRLQHLIRVIQLVRSDLQRAVEYFDRVFAEVVSLPYSKILSEVYENRISLLMEPEMMLVCKSLKRLRYNEASNLHPREDEGLSASNEEPSIMGKTLFELYLTLKRLGQDLNIIKSTRSNYAKFHSWFLDGVSLWLDMAAFKCFIQIEKAVELDNLMPLVLNVNCSSSSLDTVTIFYQIYHTFWKQLAWPDDEGSFSFVTKIIDDICRCCVFYSERMSRRVERAGAVRSVYEDRFEVTTEWCVAINSIDYVRQSIGPFVVELALEDIIQRMCEANLNKKQKYRETLQSITENAIDTVGNKMDELLEVMIKKIINSLTKLLIDCAELPQQDNSSTDRVMRYLEINFDTIHQHLSSETFSRTLDLYWEQLGEALYILIQANMQKWPPSWFKNLRDCLKIMEHSLCRDNKEIYKSKTLNCVEYLLEIHGMETADLIHRYNLERWQEQQAITESKIGMLTVRAQFIEDHLKIEILNASKLASVHSNSVCNTFVKIILLPDDAFEDVKKVKTKIYNNSCFPIYDEIFVIPLNAEQSRLEDAVVHLVVKDKDMLSVRNTFVGEAYLHFKEVPRTPAPISSLPQQHLQLSSPASFDDEKLNVLEFRQADKRARKFIQKEKLKMPKYNNFLSFPVVAISTPFGRFLKSSVLGSLAQIAGRKSKPGKSSIPGASSSGTFHHNLP